MEFRRRNRGFEHVGRLSPEDLGLPRGKSRQLLMVRAWRAVGGPILARNALPISLRRAVLSVEARDERWVEALLPMLPELGGRLLRDWPQLRIGKLRLCRAGGEVVRTLEAAEFRLPTPAAPVAGSPARGATHEPVDLAARLERAREGYLARQRSDGAPDAEE